MSELIKKVNVLDHGYVGLVGSWGDDLEPLRSARMSTDNPTGVSEKKDDNLREYLWRHQHTSPFEFCELILEIQTPLFVAREWMRHRTFCLAGDTEIYFDLPYRAKNGKLGAYKMKISEVFRKWNMPGMKKAISNMMLRQINEDSKDIQHTKINDVVYSGVKKTFEVELCDGKKITCSADHKFLFNDGWATLNEKTGLTEQNGLAVYNNNNNYQLYSNGVALPEAPETYQNADWLKALYHDANWTLDMIAEKAGVSKHTIRKWVRRHGLSRRAMGHTPWNTGKTYSLGQRTITKEHYQKILKTRSGENSNFWKGGITSDRANIARWTREQAKKVHEKYGYTCQLCEKNSLALDAHHIVPVWYDSSLGREFDNLISLCKDCHKVVTKDELSYIPLFSDKSIIIDTSRKAIKTRGNKTVGKLVAIKSIKYIGEQDCFDISVDGPYHNFVANGIIVHNSYNEFSQRYSEALDLYYVPVLERMELQSNINNQSSDGQMNEETAMFIIAEMEREQIQHRETYNKYIDDGLARELARINMPVSNYTKFRVKGNLKNWFHFVNLRIRSGAQYEIRVYAEIILEVIRELWPKMAGVFEEYTLYAISLGKTEKEILVEFIETVVEASRHDSQLTAQGLLEILTKDKLTGLRKREFMLKLGFQE